MSHLEDLLAEYYDWRGYIIRRNIKVGRLGHGGWAGELDLVAYHPKAGNLVHLEPSIDALSWQKREDRFRKKFRSGKKYIFGEVFPWLDRRTPLQQIAILPSRGRDRTSVGGGELVTIDEMVSLIRGDVVKLGKMARSAVPEQYRHLRTIQLVLCGYHRAG